MKLYKSFLIVLSTLLIMNCNSNNDEQLMEKAKELSQKFIITDGHIDTPWRMHKWGYEDISKRSPGDFDYVRAKEGGLDVPFMAIYVPATYQVTGGAKEKAEELNHFTAYSYNCDYHSADLLKELYKELGELRDKLDKNELQKKLQELQLSNEDIEKELDRNLEILKQQIL